jgi:hypothetical protein
MSKKATSNSSKFFNINREARKFYPKERSFFEDQPLSCFMLIKTPQPIYDNKRKMGYVTVRQRPF